MHVLHDAGIYFEVCEYCCSESVRKILLVIVMSYVRFNLAPVLRPPKPSPRRIKALIDGRTAADIRTAIFKVTDGRITNNFDRFARNTNAAATCSTAGTAGADGVDACLAGCEQKRSFLAWTPSKGACYMLCALATSPCTKE